LFFAIVDKYALYLYINCVIGHDQTCGTQANNARSRPLSGGGSFLVSLSLALALSELSSGRSRLESLFLDEGFGTLDSKTLDAALNALESLRLSGRTIGVISHIDQLTRRIPVRIDVKRTGVGTSTIHVKG
jgi:exonuclease SbcC